MTIAGTLYHGGAPSLKRILPPNKTKAASTADYGAEGVCNRDKVYLTNSIAAASMFASMHPSGRGCVYEVQPVGVLEDDPDFDNYGYDTLHSYQCDEAIVLRKIRLRHKQRQLFMKAFVGESR